MTSKKAAEDDRMTGTNRKKAARPKGEIRIISPIDSSCIMPPGSLEDEYYYYRYQEYYALALWALQEKFGFTF